MRRRCIRLAYSLLCVLVCAHVAVAANAPSQADLDLAKAHYRTAEINYQQGKFSDAAKEFEEAYRLTERPELLYNMGKSYDGAGDLGGALTVYRRFLGAIKDNPDRPFVQRRVEELELLIAHVEIASSVPGSVVVLDEKRLGTTPLAQPKLEVNPGAHHIEIAAEGYATYRRDLQLQRAQTEKLDVQMISLVKVIRVEKQAVPVYKRWYLWTAIGVVVVGGAVTGAVLGTRAANEIQGPHAQLPKAEVP